MTKTTQLTVVYQCYVNFSLDFDLNETSEWYVRRDTLFVKHSENDEWVEYEALLPAEEEIDWDYPVKTSVDVESID